MKFLIPFVGVAVLFGTVFWVVRPNLESRFSGVGDFPVDGYVEAPLNYIGNRYAVAGAVEGVIGSEEGLGRVIVVRTTTDSAPLPVFIPASLDGNLNFGQRYRFDVRVRDGGLIYADAMEKL